jgi:hypothetical protein
MWERVWAIEDLLLLPVLYFWWSLIHTPIGKSEWNEITASVNR